MKFLRKYIWPASVICLSIFSILPLFYAGFFSMHDDTQVARVFEMGKALKDGVFPVRWVPDLGYGYGYPIFNFYAPLAYYIGGFFNILGFDALISTKIMMGLGVILSGIFMYILAREFWGNIGGLVSAVFYVYAPYHAVDIYVRGSVGEFWAYAFIPLMFWGLYKVFKCSITCHAEFDTLKKLVPLWDSSASNEIPKPASRGEQVRAHGSRSLWARRDDRRQIIPKNLFKPVIISSIGYAGVILSHNLTAMMVFPFLLIILILSFIYGVKKKKFSTFNFQFSTLLLGFLLSAFYWLPALMEMKYTNVLSQVGGGADFRNHFVCVQQLWSSQWGFGGSASGCIDGLSFKIGKVHFLASLIAVIISSMVFVFKYHKKHLNNIYHLSDKRFVIVFSILSLFVSVFLTLDWSKSIWEVVFPMAFLQYPWRFLLLVSFFSSLLAGSLTWFLYSTFTKHRYLNAVVYLSGAALIFLVMYSNVKLFQPQTFYLRDSNFYTNDSYVKWTVSKISDEYMPKGFIKPKSENEVAKMRFKFDSDVKINSLIDNVQNIAIDLNVAKQTKLYINLAYFPAWKVYVDGKEEYMDIDKGYINIFPGHKLISVQFIETPVEKLANIVSLAGIITVITGIIYARKKAVN